jgi:ketosteroid isomerase-like protein
MTITKSNFLLALLALMLSSPLSHAQSKIDAEKAALIQAEAAFENARAAQGLEGWLSFFADDATDFPEGAPITFTKAAMRDRLQKQGWNPAAILKWQPLREDVAASADLAYTAGNWQLTGKTRKGDPLALTGKYLTVWRKQKDGAWKVVADMGVRPVGSLTL